MAESQAIHQIEYRWQQAKDMSAVASSMSPASARSWVQRIGPWVRHPGVATPTDSVRYEVFGDRSAALAWRQRDPQAVGFEDGRDGRPLASRVLLGPADLLTPEVAVAVCYAGLPEMIGPRPGAATPGSPLPPIHAAWLTRLVEDNAEALDRAAARETGLERIIAAALGDRDTPLSVQLPERCINRSPQGGSQAFLLWGLRTTVSPLLGRGGRRGWSFSTFELPLSDMDPETLPDIVFRLAQPVPQTAPMAMRTEIRVRPQEPVATPVETMPQHLARLLVIAYQDHGGDELIRLIMTNAGDYQSADQRIQAVYKALEARSSPVTVVSEEPGNAPVRVPVKARPDGGARVDSASTLAPMAPDVAGRESIYSCEIAQPVSSSAVIHAAPPPQPAAPAVPPDRRQPEPSHLPSVSSPPLDPSSRPPRTPQAVPIPPPQPVTSPPAARSIVSSSRYPWDVPQLFSGENEPGQVEETPPPATLSALLALLSAGPAADGFESAMLALRATNFRTGPHDRASARKLLRDHRWYVDVFGSHGQVQLKDILVMIFWHSVIPDLTDEQVLDELAYWAGTLAAPAAVIEALYRATEGPVGAQRLMDQALEPALAQRWLNEHGIHVPPAAPAPGKASGSQDLGPGPQGAAAPQAPAQPVAATQASAQPSDEPQTLLSLLDRQWSVPVPLVLAVCIAVIVLLLMK